MEQKHKSLKKKYKQSKDQLEKSQKEMAEALTEKSTLEQENEGLIARLKNKEDSESTKEPQLSAAFHQQEIQGFEKVIKELELTLENVQTAYKNQSEDLQYVKRQRDEEVGQLNDIVRQQIIKIQNLEQELSHTIEDKNDYQQICQDQNIKIEEWKSKERELQNYLRMKEALVDEHAMKAVQAQDQNLQLQEKLKKIELKLR